MTSVRCSLAMTLFAWRSRTQLAIHDFVDYATNCGALGIRVETVDDVIPPLERAKGHHGPALMDTVRDIKLM